LESGACLGISLIIDEFPDRINAAIHSFSVYKYNAFLNIMQANWKKNSQKGPKGRY